LCPPEALACWHEKHGLEEQIAGYQPSDAVRIRMLAAADNEYDLQIDVAADLKDDAVVDRKDDAVVDRKDDAARPYAASVVLSMEAARGATVLGAISPSGQLPVRDLPPPLDDSGAVDIGGVDAWVEKIMASLPPNQLVWMLHATSEHLHHAVLWRGGRGAGGFVRHERAVKTRDELNRAVGGLLAAIGVEGDAMRAKSAGIDEQAIERAIDDISALVRPPQRLIGNLPAGVTRLAVVAGGVLADVPFGALTWPDDEAPLGLRFAVSDLPCLRAREPLEVLSRARRGDRSLLLWPGEVIKPVLPPRGVPLEGDSANLPRLNQKLAEVRPAVVRFDCHGGAPRSAGSQPWLQLAPAGPDGRLTTEAMRKLDLTSCGTLVLGACESGLSEPLGRDERDGFVRAGFVAGAASVVAARWKAEDVTAAVVLNCFSGTSATCPGRRPAAGARCAQDPGAGPGRWGGPGGPRSAGPRRGTSEA
jgi:hypothetical protein